MKAYRLAYSKYFCATGFFECFICIFQIYFYLSTDLMAN